MASTGVVVAVLAAAAGGAILLSRRAGGASSDPYASAYGDTSGGYGPSAYGWAPGYGDSGSSGAYNDGTPGGAGGPTIGLQLSKAGESAFVADQASTSKKLRDDSALQTTLVAGAVVAPIAYKVVKAGYSGLRNAFPKGPSAASAASGEGEVAAGRFAGVGARLATPGAGIADFGALTPAGVAVGVGGGLALGVGAIKLLDVTGELNKLGDLSTRANQNSTGGQQAIVKSIALPLSAPGAFFAALAGRGSFGGNFHRAFQGTFVGNFLGWR